jgi:hypothetical protein
LLLIVGVLLAPVAARAGAALSCGDAQGFERAAVNAFVLPYRYDGPKRSSELDRSSQQIAALAHFEVLFSMLKYGEIGAIDLLAEPGRACDVDQVIERLTRASNSRALQPGQTAVLLWGRLFEEGEQLYLQSYARFFRMGGKGPERESIVVAYGNPKLQLSAELPAQGIAFPPRRIAKRDLEAIAREFTRSMVVRREARLDSPGTPLEYDPARPYPYWVSRTQGDWMWIEPMLGGPAGWVRARTGNEAAGTFSLQRWLPELAYVDALNGFMRLRAAQAGPFRASAEEMNRWRSWIDAGFARFQEAVGDADAPEATGVAQAVRGFVLWTKPGETNERVQAARLFADARERMPDYAAARNLAAVTQPLLVEASALDKSAAALMGRQLLGALALDSGADAVLYNLERYYRALAERPQLSPYPPDDLVRRLDVVRDMKSRLPSAH